jgi:hypothetical protein
MEESTLGGQMWGFGVPGSVLAAGSISTTLGRLDKVYAKAPGHVPGSGCYQAWQDQDERFVSNGTTLLRHPVSP